MMHSPASGSYNPYEMHSSAPGTYDPYDLHPPQGYLDRRPSYDDHGTYSTGLLGPSQRQMFEEESSNLEVRWRDPDLHEVIEFLSHPSGIIRANAAAHLQHLCYSDDSVKSKARTLGAIPFLLNLLTSDSLEVQRNACGALRNLSYGRRNDENKKAIKEARGILVLVGLLREVSDNELRDLITGVLWNLSSCEPLKRPIIDDALSTLVNHVIIPLLGWNVNYPEGFSGDPSHSEAYWSIVFRNSSGVLRNISSAGEYARKKMRECDGLVDSLMFLMRSAIIKNDINNKSVENCVCILRNLSFRCQEIMDPDYDKHVHAINDSSFRVAIMGSKVTENLGCFGVRKKKETTLPTETKNLTSATHQLSLSPPIRRPNDPLRGMELLWQPDVVQPYLAILSECSNPETLEAAAGAIQNLAACYWQPSIDIRAAVRKEKGLPVFVELLRMEVDRVVCAVATALRNLALDPRNKELIGKYAMKDLVSKLPNGNIQHDSGSSDDTIAAVLATLNEVIVKNVHFAKSLLEADGMERLLYIVKNKSKFSSRVFKFTSQLLYNMWQHIDLRELYRKAGYKESHFLIRPMLSRNSSGGSILQSPTSSANNTLSRPMSTQSGTRYEDRTLPRGTTRDITQIALQRPEELHLNDLGSVNVTDGLCGLSTPCQHSGHSGSHRPPVGGVQIYPPGVEYVRNHGEPVYAQVNRERKKQSIPGTDSSSSTQALLGPDSSYDPTTNEPIYPPSMPAGDSWV